MVFLLLELTFAYQPGAQSTHKKKSEKPQQLDSGYSLERDPATGELRFREKAKEPGDAAASPGAPLKIRVGVNLVEVAANVYAADGSPVRGLTAGEFHIFEDGAAERIMYFDASSQPASVALVFDASPSILRDTSEMKQAARALVENLAPQDEAAFVDFSFHTYVQIPFTHDRPALDRAIDGVDVRKMFFDTGGSNIYQSVYLVAKKLFAERTGRKAIVLLTDGQDSGLGLTLDPASAVPHPDETGGRLTFEDVVRALAAAGIEVYAISTETRPRILTPAWLTAHARQTLLTRDDRDLGIPAYTLFLVELVRRAGGQLYFLREAASLEDTYRQIAENIRLQYSLGFYPGAGEQRPGWHELRVEVSGHPEYRVAHRLGYYVPASQ